MAFEIHKEIYETQDVVIEEQVISMEDGEYDVQLPNRIPDNETLLLIQFLHGDAMAEGQVYMEEVIPETRYDFGRMWRGSVEAYKDLGIRIFARGLVRVRVLFAQIKKGFKRRLRAMPCDFCKASIKVIVNFVLMFHGCPILPGGGFDATAIAGVLVQVDNAIANGVYGPVIDALASVLPNKFWDQVFAVLQMFNLIFKVTDFLLTMICTRLGFCPSVGSPPAAGSTP